MEARVLLAADPLQVGAVYVEEDLGSDLHGDTIQISFAGGADGSQLTRWVLDGDRDKNGLGLGDVIFDTLPTGLGADGAFQVTTISANGIDKVSWSVVDGTSLLVFEFEGFDAGEKFVFSVDVDELQEFDPAQTDTELTNEGIDPITSGVEFQGSQFLATFRAPHYYQVEAEGEFRNRYDEPLVASGLDLPEDNADGKRDRSAGAFASAAQQPLPISISGTVYVEHDLDRVRDADEPGLAGVTLQLWKLSGGAYTSTGHTTVTDAAGRYRFGTDLALTPGTYQVRQVQPAGYFSVAALPGTVNGIPSGRVGSNSLNVLTAIAIPMGDLHAVNYDFAEAQPAELSGYVYHDRDDDGQRDTGEEGIGGITITLIPIDVVAPQAELTVTTDASGHYRVQGLAPGRYRVVQSVQPDGYFDGKDTAGTVAGLVSGVAVNPGDSIEDVFLGGGASGQNYNFGELAPVSIQGRVQLATPDGDRFSRGVSHDPIAGAIVRLLDAQGNVLQETTSDADGRYAFVHLHPGTYAVEEVTPAGLIDGGANPGTVAGRRVGTVNNDGSVSDIVLGSAQAAIEYDFAEYRPAVLSGTVYHDRDDDGVREAGEAGISGVRVRLYDAQGQLVDEQISGVNGSYRFQQLRLGNYTIEEIHPQGWVDGRDAAGRVDGEVRGQAVHPGDRIRDIQLRWGDVGVDYDFGEILTATIEGLVHFSTVDGDCFSEEYEHAPVVGAVVLLFDDQGVQIAQTVTDENGAYRFAGLRPGNYTVVERTPEGLFDGGTKVGTVDGISQGIISEPGTIRDIALLSGQLGTGYDFCEHAPSTLAGFVFHDRDDDGRREAGEEGIAGVRLVLRDSQGNVVDQQVTDTAGRYQFSALRAGNYTIEEQHPEGWLDGRDRAGRVDGEPTGRADQPGDAIRNIAMGWGVSGVDYNFGEILPVSVSGHVFLARSEEDCMSGSESLEPIAGVVVRLFDGQGTLIAETTTNALGKYEFNSLRPGTYDIVEVTPEGLFDGGAHAGTVEGQVRGVAEGGGTIQDIVLSSGQSGEDFDFCEHPPASISGHVFHDSNQNGQRDADEAPIAGVELVLRDQSGQVVQRGTTDSSGAYAFGALRAGIYAITEVQPDGWLDGRDRAGRIAGNTVGRADEPGDAIRDIALQYGDAGTDYDFGELLPGSITGIVHTEVGVLDCVFDSSSGELLLPNVRIDLLDDSGNLVATTQTNAEGRYTFTNVRPGTYTVRQHQPADYFDGQSTPGSHGGDTSVPNQTSGLTVTSGLHLTEYNFCEITPVMLSGYVFVDGPAVQLAEGEQLPERIADVRDGQRSADDRPLAGVQLELRHGITSVALGAGVDALPGRYADGRFIVVTDASGYYEFTGLKPGTYAVYQLHPENYIDGVDTPGSASGYVFNPGEPVNQNVRRFLTVDPRNDAIVQVNLPPGGRSVENNFSEVAVERPQIVIPPGPPPRINPPPPDQPPPILPAPRLEPVRLPLRPQQYDILATSGVPNNTWHLSVIDAGQPRGEGIAWEEATSIWLVTSGARSPIMVLANRGGWTFQTDRIGPSGRLGAHFTLGVENGLPVSGDFNGDGYDEIAVYYQGHWFIDINGNGVWDADDLWAKLGRPLDLPVTGDWDGDGKDDIGVFGRIWPGDPRALTVEPGLPDHDNPPSGQQKNVPPDEEQAPQPRRVMQLTSRGRMRADVIDHVFQYGSVGDYPVVGDWNGDGIQSIGVFREGSWRLDIDGDGRWSAADRCIQFGQRGDIPIVGDFNGDGIDELGFYRQGRFYLDSNGNRALDATDRVVELGGPGSYPVVGDWNGDGVDELGVYHAGEPVREAAQLKRAG